MFGFLRNLKIKTLGMAIAVGSSMLTIKSVDDIGAAWATYDEGVARKAEHLSGLRGAMGYGGFIHNFKNYVLRLDRPPSPRPRPPSGRPRSR